MASFKVSQFPGATDTTADSLLMLSYTSDSGATYQTRKIRVEDLLNDVAQDGDLSALITLTGVPAGSTDLGEFTGETIADSSTIKEALQALETSLELKQGALTAGPGIFIDEVTGEISVKISQFGYLAFYGELEDELAVRVLDEDDLVSNSDQDLPTQQSVKAYVDSNIADLAGIADGKFIHKDGSVPFEGDQSMGGFKLTNLGVPTQDTDAATKLYVDMAVQGLDAKASVKVATTEAITLTGLQTIDGITLAEGDRVLVKDQADASANGIYAATSGAWSRTPDAGDGDISSGMFTFVEAGTANGTKGYVLITPDPITVGTTDLIFTQFSEAGSAIAGDGIVINGNVIAVDPAVLADIADLITLTGVSGNSTDLGLFTGSTIGANKTIKEALQALEILAEQNESNVGSNNDALADHEARISANELAITDLQANDSAQDTRISDLQQAVGAADGVQDMGTFTGGTISDNVSVKAALQELETALEEVEANSGSDSAVSANTAEIQKIRQAQGTANGDTNLGSFTGGIIPANSSVKQALQALETGQAANDSELSDHEDRITDIELNLAEGNYVSVGDNVNELVGSTVAEPEPTSYLFMVVDQSSGAIKVIDKTFVETEESA